MSCVTAQSWSQTNKYQKAAVRHVTTGNTLNDGQMYKETTAEFAWTAVSS